MILVIGGTGKTGGAVLRSLADGGVPTRALVRRPPEALDERLAGVAYLVGDAADAAAVRRALAGVDQVFMAVGNGPAQRDVELAVVRAVAAAGVDHLVKVSAPVVGPDVPVAIARMHFEIEQAVEASGVGHTFLRPYAFMQNLLNHVGTIASMGILFGATGDAPINMVDARDIADVAVATLTNERHRGGALVLTGPEAVTYGDVADRLSALGQPVRYVDQSPASLRQGLQMARMPAWLIEHVVEIQAMSVATLEVPNDTIERVTGRPARRLDAFLAEHAGDFARRGDAGPVAFASLTSLSPR